MVPVQIRSKPFVNNIKLSSAVRKSGRPAFCSTIFL
jgi:hypothetical protein